MFVAALVFPQPPPSGSEGPNLVIFIVPFLIAVAAILAIVPAIFMSFLLHQPSHHRNWGIALTVWYSLESIYLGLGVVISLSSASAMYGSSTQFSVSWLEILDVAPLLGVVGGVWSIVWHTGMTRMDLARRRVGDAGRVLTGGLIIFFSIGFIPGFAIFAVPAISFMFIAMLLFFVPRAGRALGVLVLAVCGFVGVSLPSQIQDLGGHPIGAYYGFGVAIAALVAGTVVTGSGAVARLRSGRMPKKQKDGEHTRMWEPGR